MRHYLVTQTVAVQRMLAGIRQRFSDKELYMQFMQTLKSLCKLHVSQTSRYDFLPFMFIILLKKKRECWQVQKLRKKCNGSWYEYSEQRGSKHTVHPLYTPSS